MSSTATESKQDKIIRKVRAMLATAGDSGSTPAESETAMGHATHLMDKYNLDREDIEHIGDTGEIDFTNVEFCKDSINLRSSRKASWQGSLLMFIGDFVGTIGVYTSQGVGLYNFYGPRCDVEIAKELFRELELVIYTRSMLEYKGWFRGKGACFAEGFVSGLKHTLAQQLSKDVVETGLILTDQKSQMQEASKEWLKSGGTRLTKSRVTSYRKRDSRAQAAGYRQGQAHNVKHNHKVK